MRHRFFEATARREGAYACLVLNNTRDWMSSKALRVDFATLSQLLVEIIEGIQQNDPTRASLPDLGAAHSFVSIEHALNDFVSAGMCELDDIQGTGRHPCLVLMNLLPINRREHGNELSQPENRFSPPTSHVDTRTHAQTDRDGNQVSRSTSRRSALDPALIGPLPRSYSAPPLDIIEAEQQQ